MDKRMADALSASIAHWERNVAAETPGAGNTHASDCALCHEFYFRNGSMICDGCPVQLSTGREGCLGSPYNGAHFALRIWQKRPGDEDCRIAWRAAAQRELDFLKGLRAEAEGTEK